MRKNHNEFHLLEQLLDQPPAFQMNEERSSANLSEIMEQIEQIEAREHRIKWIRRAMITVPMILAIILSANWVSQSELSFPLPFTNSQDHQQLTGEAPEVWEESPVFEIRSGPEDSSPVYAIGDEEEYGLEITEVLSEAIPHIETSPQDPSLPRFFFAEEGYSNNWYILNPSEEIDGQQFKVTAQNFDYPSESVTLVPDTELQHYDDQIWQARQFFAFPDNGLWKLFLYVDDQMIGDIVINVQPFSDSIPTFIERDLKEAAEVAQKFSIPINNYSFKNFNELESNKELYSFIYKNLLRPVLTTIDREVERTDAPFVYLNNDESEGYVIVLNHEDIPYFYYIRNTDGHWETEDPRGK
ncbi:hypothetical protein [Bacillus horti]|uniref:DUF4367 domain-containing protein n=1 Tax=Caldalkalibacillus horti TaxID=77523 RepID=A0ABT9VWM2_9BACI|nr:hypothetical protein [Bacillus horti]MDQ0165274.1 hypothetical protein [Bacillus horti]